MKGYIGSYNLPRALLECPRANIQLPTHVSSYTMYVGRDVLEKVDTPATRTNWSPADMIAGEPEKPGALRELEAGYGANEASDNGEVLGGAEVGAPVEGVEEDEGEDASLDEEEGEPDDDSTLAVAGYDGVVERWRLFVEENRVDGII